MYDPVIGRFTTADIVVQNFSNPQTLNRYAYCGNNPLAYVDPSGHFFLIDDLIGYLIVGSVIMRGIQTDWDPAEMAKGIACDAASAALFYGAGSLSSALGKGLSPILQKTIQVGLHIGAGAISGGMNSAVMGGDFGMGALTGAVSGGVGCAVGAAIPSKNFWPQFGGQTIAGAISGGIAAEMYGGKFMDGFAQGARTAAIAYIFNDCGPGHENEEDTMTVEGEASYYLKTGYPTSTGEYYDGTGMTGAMHYDELGFKPGTTVNVKTRNMPSKNVDIKINDHGPWAVDGKGKLITPIRPRGGFVLDMSPASFIKVSPSGTLREGHIPVTVTIPKTK